MYAWQRNITDEAGNLLYNASVEVRHADTLELATIYADRDGTTPRDNPFRTRASFARFWAPQGHYQITAIDGEDERVWEDVRLGFTLADMPDLTALLTPIINGVLTPALEAAQATVDAIPTLVSFHVLGDGTSSGEPDNVTTSRLGQGVYRVGFTGEGFTEYNVKLTVWDPSGDRLYSAMMEEQEDNGFTYTVRSIFDEASNSDARVEVEISYVGLQSLFAYRFVAINTNGKVNTSQDGATWADGGFIEGSSQSREWTPACYHTALNRVYTVARTGLTSPVRMRVAYMDENGTWTVLTPAVPGFLGSATELVYAPWVGASGRLYLACRQSGGNEGELWYSDNGGTSWTQVTWTDGKSSSQWDIGSVLVLADRIVVVAPTGSDSNSQRHVYVSTDGTNFTATLGPITGDIVVGDGFAHDRMAYSPTHDLIFVFGSSQSSFNPARFWTMNATATAVVNAPANLPTANNADSFGAIATPTCVLCGYGGTVDFVRRPGGSFSGITNANFATPKQLARSEGQAGRIVAATASQGFAYSDDDGASWTFAAAATAHSDWRAMVATS